MEEKDYPKKPVTWTRMGLLGSHGSSQPHGRGHLTLLDLRFFSGTGKLVAGVKGWLTAATLLSHLIPTNAHSHVGFAGVVFSECSHSVSLVNIEADLQASGLLEQPVSQVRNLKTRALFSYLPLH